MLIDSHLVPHLVCPVGCPRDGFGQARRRSLRKSVLGAPAQKSFSILPALSKAAKCKGGEGVAKVTSQANRKAQLVGVCSF